MTDMFTDSVIEGNQIFQELIQLETATAKEIANNVDVSKRTVERELSELEKYGEITKTETSGAFEADKWHSNVGENSRLKTIHIANLSIDSCNTRTSKNPRVDEEFIQSLEENGIVNPLIVRPRENKRERDTNKPLEAGEQEYYIVAGRRRYHAAVHAKIQKIDCVIKHLSDKEANLLSLRENLNRQ